MGVDTLVAAKETILGKPANLVEAHRMLALLEGKTHYVVTGVCLIHFARASAKRLFFRSKRRLRSVVR